MPKLKIMTIFGTRPEIIKLSRIMAKLDRFTSHIMVHTGQSYDYEMSQVFFDDLQIRKPDYFLEVKSETLGGQIANIIGRSEEVLQKEAPDAVLILGDTNSALAIIMAKRMKIPIFHMEAGNRAFDENVPEEINRRMIDHISDINMTFSEHSRSNLLREGLHPAKIILTGSPTAEILDYHKQSIAKSKILEELGLSRVRYFVISVHREDNVENPDKLAKFVECLNAVAGHYQIPMMVSTHPRTAKRLEELGMKADPLVNFHKPFGFFDYINLQKNAFCILSDSGTIPEESAMLGLPAVQLRGSSERPEAFDEGNLMLCPLDKDRIVQAIEIVTRQHAEGEKFNMPAVYRDLNVSSKVVRHIVGMTDTVKKRRANGFY